MRAVILALAARLALGQDEQASLLQTASGAALQHRASAQSHDHERFESEDEAEDLEGTMGKKECTTWLADEAVANAHAELEETRQQLTTLGYSSRKPIKASIKIGAYCPAFIADTALEFTGTPCENREAALQQCIGGLEDTCKFVKSALKKLISKAKGQLRSAMSRFPPHLRHHFNALLEPVHEALKTVTDLVDDSIDCKPFKKNQMTTGELTADSFKELQATFQEAITALLGAQQGTQNLGLLLEQQDSSVHNVTEAK